MTNISTITTNHSQANNPTSIPNNQIHKKQLKHKRKSLTNTNINTNKQANNQINTKLYTQKPITFKHETRKVTRNPQAEITNQSPNQAITKTTNTKQTNNQSNQPKPKGKLQAIHNTK